MNYITTLVQVPSKQPQDKMLLSPPLKNETCQSPAFFPKQSSCVGAVQRSHVQHLAWRLYCTLGLEKPSHREFSTIQTTVCFNAAEPLTWSIAALNLGVLVLCSESTASMNRNQWDKALKNVSISNRMHFQKSAPFLPFYCYYCPYVLLQTSFS